jgi:DNA-binding NarL/FixJ family response regulator
MTKQNTKILLVDDHVLVRAGIRNLIESIDGYSVIAEASNIADAMLKLDTTTPDIVITDIDMGSDNGLDLVSHIKKRQPDIAIVILSMHSSGELVSNALQLGASAYLLKEAAPEELGIALAAVTRMETFLSPAVSTKMINRFVRPSTPDNDPLKSLTQRQIQILTLLAQGASTKEIAYSLDLSDKTVAAHRSQIMERIGVRDLVSLVLFAVKHGLVDVNKP